MPLWSLGVAHSANTEQVMTVMRTFLTAQSYRHRTKMSLNFGGKIGIYIVVKYLEHLDSLYFWFYLFEWSMEKIIFPYSLSRYVQVYFFNLKTEREKNSNFFLQHYTPQPQKGTEGRFLNVLKLIISVFWMLCFSSTKCGHQKRCHLWQTTTTATI